MIIDSDLINFRNLNLQNIIDNDEACRYLGREWNERSLAVHEGALVDQFFAKKALEVAKVGRYDPLCFSTLLNMTNTALHALKKFNSLQAFLQGLSAAGFKRIIPPDLRRLLQLEGDYVASCEASNRGPCLPFLYAYRREYELRGLVALQEIFAAVAPYAIEPWGRPPAMDLKELMSAKDRCHRARMGWTSLF